MKPFHGFASYRARRIAMVFSAVFCSLSMLIVTEVASNADTGGTRGARADTYVDTGQPNSSFGTQNVVKARYTDGSIQVAFFDFGKRDPSTVSSASVTLKVASKGTDRAYVVAMNSEVSNSLTASITNRSAKLGNKVAEFNVPSAGNSVTFDVTPLAKAGQVRFAISAAGSSSTSFVSSEGAAKDRPSVQYVRKGGGTTQTTPTTRGTTATTRKPTTTTDKPGGGGNDCATSNAPSGYNQLKFCDSFDGSSLDTSKWEPSWLGGNNVTKAPNGSMTNCSDPKQLSVSGGSLHMMLDKRSCDGHAYDGATLDTAPHYTVQDGYIEARMYLPADNNGAVANWPGFWTDGTGTWPHTGENDIMEGMHGRTTATYHDDGGAHGTGCSGGAGWHTYAASVKNGTATIYYDGKSCGSYKTVQAPHFLILQTSSQGEAGVTLDHSDTMVDYVRVWQ